MDMVQIFTCGGKYEKYLSFFWHLGWVDHCLELIIANLPILVLWRIMITLNMKYTDYYANCYIDNYMYIQGDDDTDDYIYDDTNIIFAHLVRIREHFLDVHFAHLRRTQDNLSPVFWPFELLGCVHKCCMIILFLWDWILGAAYLKKKTKLLKFPVWFMA